MPAVGLRIGDAEREQLAATLREHYAAGRLTHDELTERLDACLRARTDADLKPLLADLPVLRTPQRPRRGVWAAAWRRWAGVSVTVWAIWGVGAATGGGADGLWPLWVSGPWAAILASKAIRGEEPRLPHERGRRRHLHVERGHSRF